MGRIPGLSASPDREVPQSQLRSSRGPFYREGHAVYEFTRDEFVGAREAMLQHYHIKGAPQWKEPPEFESRPKEHQSLYQKILCAMKAFPFRSFRTTSPFLPEAMVAQVYEIARPGDILVQRRDGAPQLEFAGKLLWNCNWIHAALYVGNGLIIESTRGGVELRPLDNFLRGVNHAALARPQYKSDEDREAVIGYTMSQVGKPFDSGLDITEDGRQYCTELLYRALQKMKTPPQIPLRKMLGVGKEIVTADDLISIPGTRLLWASEDPETTYTIFTPVRNALSAILSPHQHRESPLSPPFRGISGLPGKKQIPGSS
ncbi:MAG: hypothetical protein HYU64_00520 [Armatimonadetes bacterium]|nr:hypothetical protein [Armatimonadota bacterium]